MGTRTRSEVRHARAGTTSPAELTWEVARGIHRRCCRDGSCDGAFEHLTAAAVAVEMLRSTA